MIYLIWRNIFLIFHTLTQFWKKIRESNVFTQETTKELIWQNIFWWGEYLIHFSTASAMASLEKISWNQLIWSVVDFTGFLTKYEKFLMLLLSKIPWKQQFTTDLGRLIANFNFQCYLWKIHNICLSLLKIESLS